MRKKKIHILLLSLFSLIFFIERVSAQDNLVSQQRLKKHVFALADDSMGGRNTATPGGQMAANYIKSQYQSLGLLPKSSNDSYLQDFVYFAGKIYVEKNEVKIGKTKLVPQEDYDVLNISSNGQVSAKAAYVKNGIETPDKINDYVNMENLAGKIFIIDITTPKEIDTHDKNYKLTEQSVRIDIAIKKGASAILFYSSDPNENIKPNLKIKAKECGIPVVFLKKGYIEQDLLAQNLKVSVCVNLEKNQKTSQNIIGFINNRAENTIVIGAHYDHLGLGEDGNSLHRGEPGIHNGADDNASGVASIIELAKKIKETPNTYKNYNYLFVAFSGEELGLYGSKAFVDNIANQIDSQKIDCMINLDMVGRLGDKEKNLEINGVGSSPSFDTIINNISLEGIRVKKGMEGIGPSDHSSFYLKNMPVLHFFTGQHEDYHKPSDDAEKVNIEGMQKVCEYILMTIQQIETRGKLSFTKTKEDSTSTPRFKISLGIIPDYMYDGEGLRIDGVSDGKPAQKAGLLRGDVIIQLGEKTVADMSTYMKTLTQFKKGDETIIVVKRGKEIIKMSVVF